MAIYIIEEGDTLESIASSYGLAWRELYFHDNNANFRRQNPDHRHIASGQELWVPHDLENVYFANSDILDSPVIEIVMEDEAKAQMDEGIDRINPYMLTEMNNLHEYKLQAGDTLEKIAEALECTWQEIAMINWATDDFDEIDWYLNNYVGTKESKGIKTKFEGNEDSGIILLPKYVDAISRRRITSVRVSRSEIQKG